MTKYRRNWKRPMMTWMNFTGMILMCQTLKCRMSNKISLRNKRQVLNKFKEALRKEKSSTLLMMKVTIWIQTQMTKKKMAKS